jgi:hypothetical protein
VSCLFLDGSADPPQMLPEGVGRLGCPPRQEIAESHLLAQGLAGLDLAGLVPLGLRDLVRGGQRFRGPGRP